MKRTPIKRKVGIRPERESQKATLASIHEKCDESLKARGIRDKVVWRSRQAKKVMKPRAKKRARQESLYRTLVAKLIREARDRGEVCPVMRKVFNATSQIDQCHHQAGREGALLLMKEHFLLCSWIGHEWIHQHPNEAREHGWLYEVRREGNEWVKTNK